MRRPHTKSDALVMGELFHKALEWYMPTKNLDRALSVIDRQEFDNEFDKMKLMAMMYGYDLAYKDDGIKVISIEQKFNFPLTNPATGRASRTWKVAGKMDAIVEWKGDLWVMEHKTTSQDVEPGSVYWQRLRMDSQVSTYFVAAQKMGHDVKGILYDVVVKPRKRPLLATPTDKLKYTKSGDLYSNQRLDDERPDLYMHRCLKDIGNDPKSFLARGIVLRGDIEQEEAAYDLWQTAYMIHASTRAGRWPRNPGNCFLYNRPCEYFDVCTGVADLGDDLRFRTADSEHEEL
jgi:hypothetical protein